MKTYIAIEIGNSAYTEFLMKDNKFHQTQDAIFLGEVKANSPEEAEEKIKQNTRIYDKIKIYEINRRP